jgi:hypothetical protein
MTVQEVWECYNDGEPVFNANGNQTGIKPPLRLVEQYWKAEWRGGPTVGSKYIYFSVAHVCLAEPPSLVAAKGTSRLD